MTTWARDEKHEAQYGYPLYRAAFGPWALTVWRGDTCRPPAPNEWTVYWVADDDEWQDTIGSAPTLHVAQRLAMEWVLKRIVEASAQVEEAAKEWQAEEEQGVK